ncbi:MAG: hypothetical protein M5U28_21375 [Sandaracinaceae bacterium]|nr:hypothetical protein [Sandaracinaceae bacterium]
MIHERRDLILEPGSRILVAECLSGDPPEIRFHDGRFGRRDRRLVTRSSRTITQADFDTPPPATPTISNGRPATSFDRRRDDGDLAGALAGLALIALLPRSREPHGAGAHDGLIGDAGADVDDIHGNTIFTMSYVTQIAFGLAVVLVATAGLAATFGADRIRDALMRFATGAVVVALGLPMLAGVLARASCDGPRGAGMSRCIPLFIVAVAVGHAALGVFLLRRRAGAERSRFAADLEAARGRERVRLIPPSPARTFDELAQGHAVPRRRRRASAGRTDARS